jgi:hypothetical protein
MNHDDFRIVANDLQYLANWGPEISEGEIRRGSAILRRLLVEDVYGYAWKEIGKLNQPRLIAVDLSPILTPDNLPSIIFSLAAGANFRNIRTACMIITEGDRTIGMNLHPPICTNGYPGEREFTLSEFLSSVSGIVGGKTFNRREVIKYIANVKGGVHLGSKQRKSEQKLITRIQKIENKMQVHTTDGLLVEIVAIGQALGNSENAKEFIKCVENKYDK